jgi:SRSO17 transposase
MKRRQPDFSRQAERLQSYLDSLTRTVGHADRVVPLENYTKGLLLPLERKSVEPMAARLAPGNVRQMHQSLHHIVADAAWGDAALLQEVRNQVLPVMTRRHCLLAWIVDDTGFPKKGNHSVGVTRQYCGQVGKQENCRIAVSISLATEQASLPVRYQLYLPEIWAHDPERRRKAGVPEDVQFQIKPEIALAQIRSLLEEGVPRGVVLADAAYGNDHSFREELETLGFQYVVGIQSSTSVWPPGTAPLPPRARTATGRPASLLRREKHHQPLSVKELALCLSPSDWRRVSWREGTRGTMHSRFARLRVRVAHRDYWRSEPHPEQWLLIEWPKTEKEPTKYWLSKLPESIALRRLVLLAKQRWIIERDYQELKQELGLGHFEGRGWRGFHHHATLAIAAYGYLVRERCLFPPPPGSSPLRAAHLRLHLQRRETGYTPRGAAGANRKA